MMEFLRAGGPMLWLIVLFGVIAIFVFLEKLFQLRRNQVNVRELVTGLVNVLKRDAMLEAITLCDTTPGPVAKLLNAAIQAYQNDDDIKPAIEDTAKTELNRLESRLNILSTIANIAPLLGLLGTVIGMYETFNDISVSAGMSLAVLSGGVLQQTGTPEEVYRKPANRFVASFLGDGNFLEGTVAAVQDSHVIMQTALGDLRCGIFEKDLKIGEKRDLLIRPEALIFDAAPDAANRVDAVVEDGVFLGDHREWKLRCGNVSLEGSESAAPARIVGSSVSLAIRPELIAVLGGE